MSAQPRLDDDTLVPPGDWPGMRAFWRPGRDEHVQVRLEWTMPEPLAGRLSAAWEVIASQIADPSITILVTSSLGAIEHPLSDEQRRDLLALATRVCEVLRGEAAGVEPLTWEFREDPGRRRHEPLFDLGMTVCLRREGAGEASARLWPDPSLTPEALARMVSIRFPGAVLAYAPADDSPDAPFGVLASAIEIAVDAGTAPEFFAPEPFSTGLVSDAALEVERLGDAGAPTPVTISVSDVDLDLVMREFLDTLESVIVSDACGAERELTDATVDALTRAKASIAGALAMRTAPILAGGVSTGLADCARQRLRDAFAQDLRTAYAMSAAVCLPLVRQPSALRVYGSVSGAGRVVDGRAMAWPGTGGPSGRPAIALLCEGAETASTRLTLDYTVTHVEGTRRVRLHEPRAFPLATVVVPLPRREHPAPPVLVAHAARPAVPRSESPATAISDSMRWTYECIYQRPNVPHDTVTVSLASDGSVPPPAPAVPVDLLRALMTWRYNGAVLAHALEPGSPGAGAVRAIAFFSRVATALADALARASETPVAAADSAVPSRQPLLTIVDRDGAPPAVACASGESAAVRVERIGADGMPLADQSALEAGPVLIRRVTEGGRSVPRDARALAEVRVDRNRDLIASAATNPAFILATRFVSFAEPVIPLLDVDEEIDLAAVAGAAPATSDRLVALYESLLGDGKAPATVALNVSYAPAIPLPGRTLVPLVAIPPSRFADVASMVALGLGEFIDAWHFQAGATADGCRIEVTVFDGAQEPRPLLRLRRIWLPLAAIE